MLSKTYNDAQAYWFRNSCISFSPDLFRTGKVQINYGFCEKLRSLPYLQREDQQNDEMMNCLLFC